MLRRTPLTNVVTTSNACRTTNVDTDRRRPAGHFVRHRGRVGRAGAGRPRTCGAGRGTDVPRTTWPRAGTAGKPATRFLAASSVTVIRVDPTRPPAHQCAWHLSSTRIRSRRGIERSESMSGDGFPALRKRAADGQCRCGDPATAPPHLTPAGRSGQSFHRLYMVVARIVSSTRISSAEALNTYMAGAALRHRTWCFQRDHASPTSRGE